MLTSYIQTSNSWALWSLIANSVNARVTAMCVEPLVTRNPCGGAVLRLPVFCPYRQEYWNQSRNRLRKNTWSTILYQLYIRGHQRKTEKIKLFLIDWLAFNQDRTFTWVIFYLQKPACRALIVHKQESYSREYSYFFMIEALARTTSVLTLFCWKIDDLHECCTIVRVSSVVDVDSWKGSLKIDLMIQNVERFSVLVNVASFRSVSTVLSLCFCNDQIHAPQ